MVFRGPITGKVGGVMQLVNVTPHPVDLTVDGQQLCIPPSGPVARVAVARELLHEIEVMGARIPVNIITPGVTVDLPVYRDGVMLIVSRLVAEANPERCDLVFPDSLSRSDTGDVVGCAAFGTLRRSDRDVVCPLTVSLTLQ